jgi:hypothetical protein
LRISQSLESNFTSLRRWTEHEPAVSMTHLTVVQALQPFAAELMESLVRQGRDDLASQLRTLPLVDRCRCGDDFCTTFYTAKRPTGAYGVGHSNLVVESREGMIILDLVQDRIHCVEILYRRDVREALTAVLP